MGVNEYVIRNTHERPDKSGVVRPYLTRTFEGRQYPVVITDAELDAVGTMGEAVPVPEGLETVPLRAKDTHELLNTLIKEQQASRKVTQSLLAELQRLHLHLTAPRPRPLSRWQRLKFWLYRRFTGS